LRPASTFRVIESVEDRWPGSQTGSHLHPIPGYASRRRIRISAGQRPISLRQPTLSDVSAITRVQRPQYVSARTNDVEARKPGVGPADREGAAAAWERGWLRHLARPRVRLRKILRTATASGDGPGLGRRSSRRVARSRGTAGG
jgi:hypothetical protein